MGRCGSTIIEDGMRIDTFTGEVLGQHLEPDSFSLNSSPLYIYNRSIRFFSLCRRSMPGPNEHVNRVVEAFTQLEEAWNTHKAKYRPRKYFLSQKLLCKELCKEFEYGCTIKKAIHDKNRLKVQLRIYKDLFLTIKNKRWPHEFTLDNKPSSTNFDLVQNSLLQGERSPDTRSETREQQTISAHLWLFSLV